MPRRHLSREAKRPIVMLLGSHCVVPHSRVSVQSKVADRSSLRSRSFSWRVYQSDHLSKSKSKIHEITPRKHTNTEERREPTQHGRRTRQRTQATPATLKASWPIPCWFSDFLCSYPSYHYSVSPLPLPCFFACHCFFCSRVWFKALHLDCSSPSFPFLFLLPIAAAAHLCVSWSKFVFLTCFVNVSVFLSVWLSVLCLHCSLCFVFSCACGHAQTQAKHSINFCKTYYT